MSGGVPGQAWKPSVGANITRVRASLAAAERQLGFPLDEARKALDRLEVQIKELRRKDRA